MRGPLLVLLVLPAALAAGTQKHFDLLATFEPPEEKGETGAVAVTFRPLDPDLRLNESPAPRLQLDLAQAILVDRQPLPPRSIPAYDPLTAEYIDLSKPVRFPVSLSPLAEPGTHEVDAEVVYFYCSVREAWCRRGTADIDFTVTVP